MIILIKKLLSIQIIVQKHKSRTIKLPQNQDKITKQSNPYQTQVLTITEQKSSKLILPSLLESALSSINFNVYSSTFSFKCRLISLKSFMSMNPLFALSYFLKIAAIYLFDSLMYGLVSIAFINSPKLIPPVYSVSNSATISQTVFLLGWKPFCVKSSFKSLGSKTPMPVESYASNTSFRLMTSWMLSCPTKQSPGSNLPWSIAALTLDLNRMAYLSQFYRIWTVFLSGLQPILLRRDSLSGVYFIYFGEGALNELVLVLSTVLEVILMDILQQRYQIIITFLILITVFSSS